MRLKAFQVKNYKTIEDSGRVEIDTNVSCLMGKNESGKSAVMQALWKFNNVAGAKFDRLFDLPAEHFTRLRTTDPEVVVLEFSLEEADKAAFLKEFKALNSAPDVVTIRATYDGKRTFDFKLSYTPAKYSSVSGIIQSIVGALNTLAASTTNTEEQSKITAAVTALEALRVAGDPNKTADEIGSQPIQNASTALQAIPKERLGTLGQTATEALKKFAAHSGTWDLKTKVEKWIESMLPIFIYFEDYGRLKTRIHLPEFITKQQQSQQGGLKDPEEQMLLRTQVAMFEWANLDPAELLRLGQPKQGSETLEQVNRRKDERARILESASYHLSGDWVDWWDQRSHTYTFPLMAMTLSYESRTT